MQNRSDSIYGVVVIGGYVQGLANTRILGREGIPIIVIDTENCIARYSKYCNKYFQCPDYTSKEFVDFLIKINTSEGLKNWLLLPSNDHMVYNISRNKGLLSKYYRIITEDFDVLRKIYNKRELLSIAQSIDVSIPRTFFPNRDHPKSLNLRYPAIIKGNNGLNFFKKYKTKAIIIYRDEELIQAIEIMLKGIEPKEYFIQEVVPWDNKTISVALFAEKGILHSYWMGIKLRERPLRFGTATCCRSLYEEELLDPVERIIKELNYSGVCEVEFIKDSRDNKYKLIEINPRTWMWVGLAEKSGVNFPLAIYRYIDETYLPNQVHYRINLYWINLYTDMLYAINGILKGYFSFAEVIKSYQRFIEASWDLYNPIPFFMHGAMLISRMFHRLLPK